MIDIGVGCTFEPKTFSLTGLQSIIIHCINRCNWKATGTQYRLIRCVWLIIMWMETHSCPGITFCMNWLNYETMSLTDANVNAILPKKRWISKIPAIRFTYRRSEIFSKKVSNLKKTTTTIPGQMLGQDRGPKSASGKVHPNVWFEEARFRESSTDTDRQNRRLHHEVWTGRAR